MPDEQAQQSQQNDERTLRLIDYLGELWQRPHEPSAESLKRITEFVASLPEEYREVGLKVIAQHLVNNMSLHYLEILAIFEQGAEQEGIDAEEREGTLADVMPDFLTMMGLSDKVAVQSIDELVRLSNVTIGTYGLTRPNSASEAQRLVYELMNLYCRPLIREHLIVNQTQLTKAIEPTMRKAIDFMPFEDPLSKMAESAVDDKKLSESAA